MWNNRMTMTFRALSKSVCANTSVCANMYGPPTAGIPIDRPVTPIKPGSQSVSSANGIPPPSRYGSNGRKGASGQFDDHETKKYLKPVPSCSPGARLQKKGNYMKLGDWGGLFTGLIFGLAAVALPVPVSAETAKTANSISPFASVAAPGPYAVGYRMVSQYDYTRSYRGAIDPITGQPTLGERARPIQTLIWYPAQDASGPVMTEEDYLRTGASDDRLDLLPDAVKTRGDAAIQSLKRGMSHSLPVNEISADLSAELLAHVDAPSAAGRFPVVIYAPSLQSTAAENADLCEFLASHGYVVIASPSVGPSSREMPNTREGIDTQAGDIEFLIGFAHGLPQADIGKIAVVGFSWGGMSNLFVAAKDNRVGALVDLDGSARYYPELVSSAGFITPARVTTPLLFFAQSPFEIEDLQPGLDRNTSFLSKMAFADVYRVTLYPFQHVSFSSVRTLRVLRASPKTEYGRDEMDAAYGWMEVYTWHFLDGYLKGDPAGLQFLDAAPQQLGVPAHLLSINVQKSTGAPPTREAFAAELARTNFEHVAEDYKAFHARVPELQFAEQELNQWGYDLMAAGRTKPAVHILELESELYPNSGNAYDSLGEAYAKDGDKSRAIAAYHHSLLLTPSNANAIAQLKVLGAR